MRRAVTGQKEREGERCECMQRSLPISLSLPSLFISLRPVNRVRTPSSPVRERERERKRERERERKKERKRERWRERESERDGERKGERDKEGGRERELLFLFLKGMTGALAPYSYLVLISLPLCQRIQGKQNRATFWH